MWPWRNFLSPSSSSFLNAGVCETPLLKVCREDLVTNTGLISSKWLLFHVSVFELFKIRCHVFSSPHPKPSTYINMEGGERKGSLFIWFGGEECGFLVLFVAISSLELGSWVASLMVLTWILDSSICYTGERGEHRVLSLCPCHNLPTCASSWGSHSNRRPSCKQSRESTTTQLEWQTAFWPRALGPRYGSGNPKWHVGPRSTILDRCWVTTTSRYQWGQRTWPRPCLRGQSGELSLGDFRVL